MKLQPVLRSLSPVLQPRLLLCLPLLLLLNGCAGAGSEHVRKEYYENGRTKLVIIDHNDVHGTLQKVDVTNAAASTEDEGGYKHKAGAKSLSATGDSDFIKAIAAGAIEGYKASQTGGASTLLNK